MSSNSALPTAADILDRFYKAETVYMSLPAEQRDFQSTMGLTISPDIELYQSPDLPYGGVYHGHDGFLEWSEAMSSYFSELEVLEPKVFEREGADEVVVLSTLKLKTRSTGKAWVAPLAQAVKVDREKGLITMIRPFYWDVKGLNEVLGKQT